MNRIFTITLLAASALTAGATQQRLSAKGSEVFGYLGYADEYRFVPAMTKLEGHDFKRIWNDPRYATDQAIMTAGWLVGDKVCGIATFSFMGMTYATYSVQCDLASGRTIEMAELPEGTPVFDLAALDKDNGTLYGVVKRDKKYFFCSAPVEDPMNLTDIIETTSLDQMHILSLTYREDDKNLYAVNTQGEFLRVGRDGSSEVLAMLQTDKEIASYYTGLAYVPADGEYIWNVNFDDYSASTFAINPDTYELTLIDDCPASEQYMFFLNLDGSYDAQAPCRPQLGEISFPEGNLSGSVSFILPTALQDGSNIDGELSYNIICDNEPYTEGKAAPGATVTADFKNLTQEFHSFGITVTSAGHTSPMQLASAYIGQDIPVAPTGVTLTKDELKWNPVTEGVNGGYVDAKAMRYHIYFEGDEVGETTATTFTPDLPTDRPVSAMTMSVVAEYDNIFSEETVSNYIVLGQPLEMPVEITPTRDEMMTFTGVDANGSDNGWTYNAGHSSFCVYINDKDADAWIFTPAINFPAADCYYTLAFQARSLKADITGECLGVYIGKTDKPEEMKLVGETFSPQPSTYGDYERLLKADEPGSYIIGFRYSSPAGKYGVELCNLSLTDGGVTPDSPARPTGVSATALPQGELKARVDFEFPTTDVSGNKLDPETRLRAVVSGESKAVATGKPGEKGYATVSTKQGDNKLSVVVSIDGKNSPVGYCNVYTGVVKPLGVTNMGYQPLDNMMGVMVAWTEVTKGQDGGYVDPDDITYTVLRYEDTGYASTWIPVAEGLTDTMFTYEMEEGTPQQLLRLAVCAANAAGRSEEMSVVSLVAGTPYALPMEDDFALADDEGAKYAPYVNFRLNENYVNFNFVTPEELGSEFADESGYYFMATGTNGSKARLSLPCFTTKDGGAELTLMSLCGNGFSPLSVWVDCVDFNSAKFVGTMPEEGGLVEKSFRLPESTDRKGWVQVFVEGTIEDYGMLALRGFRVTPVAGVDAVGQQAMEVRAGHGLLVVTGVEGERLEVLTLSGSRVALRDKAAEVESIALPAGIYIVKAAGSAVKTIVK